MNLVFRLFVLSPPLTRGFAFKNPMIERVPPELIRAILECLPTLDRQAELVKLATLAPVFIPAIDLLLYSPRLTSLTGIEHLLLLLETDERNLRTQLRKTGELTESVEPDSEELIWLLLSSRIKSLSIQCRDFGARGWGGKLARLMTKGRFIKELDITGLEDLRIKHLVGVGGKHPPPFPLEDAKDENEQKLILDSKKALTHLTLRSTTFRAHSLTTSPHLSYTLNSLTHLTLINLGLGAPSTHFLNLLNSAPALIALHISLVRDLTREQLEVGLLSVATRLRRLGIGSLTDSQENCLEIVLPLLTRVEFLLVTIPVPSLVQLGVMPSCVRTLRLERGGTVAYSSRMTTRRWEEQEDRVVQAIVDSLTRGDISQLERLVMFTPNRGQRRIENICHTRGIQFVPL